MQYLNVLCLCIRTCSAQSSMFHVERRSRNALNITTTIVIVLVLVLVIIIIILRTSENAWNGHICAWYPQITPLNRQQSMLFMPLKCNLGVKMRLINLTQGVRHFLEIQIYETGPFFKQKWSQIQATVGSFYRSMTCFRLSPESPNVYWHLICRGQQWQQLSANQIAPYYAALSFRLQYVAQSMAVAAKAKVAWNYGKSFQFWIGIRKWVGNKANKTGVPT